MTGVRADLSQFYPFKAMIEQVLGHTEFQKIKDIGGLPALKATVMRLIRQIEVSIAATVIIADDEWHTEISETLARGKDLLSNCKSADELFACLATILARLCFLQIGLVPNQLRNTKPLPLRVENWKLTAYRSVQYVQSTAQKKRQRESLAQKSNR